LHSATGVFDSKKFGGASMLESRLPNPPEDFDRLARRGPWGAIALCGIAVTVVMAIWFAFYFLAFLPRGHVQ
jgi:hypothetical protein